MIIRRNYAALLMNLITTKKLINILTIWKFFNIIFGAALPT